MYRLLEILRSARHRKAMYLESVDVSSAQNFLHGFTVGCFVCGLEMPFEISERVTLQHGWKWNAAAPIAQMRAQGLSEEQIVDELFAIAIDSWAECDG